MADGTAVLAPTPLGALLRRVWALAAPTTAVSAIQSACQLVEPVLASRQGTAALAGWAVVLPFALLMQQMSAGAMGGGVVSAIARTLGAGKREEASALVLHALVISIGFALVFMVLLAGFPAEILDAIGGPEVAAAAASYCAWLFGAGRHPGLAGEYPRLRAARRRAACAGLARAAARLARLPAAGLGADGAGRAGAEGRRHRLRGDDGGGQHRHGGGGAGRRRRLHAHASGEAAGERCSPASSRSGWWPAPWRPSPTSPPSW